MAKKLKMRLLASELEILDVLWTIGAATIVEVQRKLARSPGYTTVQTRLNRMATKKLLHRSDLRPAKYTAAIAREDASANDLGMLVNRVSEGQVVPLVAQLLDNRTLSPAEFDEIKALIKDAERRVKNKIHKEDHE
ncbi:MAG: BlaI/MecI/CopY family transcriptional regulator [Pirellula sp.]